MSSIPTDSRTSHRLCPSGATFGAELAEDRLRHWNRQRAVVAQVAGQDDQPQPVQYGERVDAVFQLEAAAASRTAAEQSGRARMLWVRGQARVVHREPRPLACSSHCASARALALGVRCAVPASPVRWRCGVRPRAAAWHRSRAGRVSCGFATGPSQPGLRCGRTQQCVASVSSRTVRCRSPRRPSPRRGPTSTWSAIARSGPRRRPCAQQGRRGHGVVDHVEHAALGAQRPMPARSAHLRARDWRWSRRTPAASTGATLPPRCRLGGVDEVDVDAGLATVCHRLLVLPNRNAD